MDHLTSSLDPDTPNPRQRQLDRRRREALSRLDGIEAELAALRRAREGVSDDDEHDPDGVPLSAQWDRLEGLKQSALATLAAVEDALEGERRGEATRCRSCGRPIAPARLAVRPEATTCIDCAL